MCFVRILTISSLYNKYKCVVMGVIVREVKNMLKLQELSEVYEICIEFRLSRAFSVNLGRLEGSASQNFNA